MAIERFEEQIMPKGKGTYGHKVGRPPKKYQAGGQTEAVMDAAMKGQELKSISLENIPTQNAPDRNEMSPIGGEVGTGMYKEGGIIKKAIGKFKEKKAGRKREKQRKQSVKDYPITGVVQPKGTPKKGLKPAKVPSNPPLFKGDTAREKIIHAIPGLSKTPAGKRALNKNKKVNNKMQKVAPKGGHSLEPAKITKGGKKKKQWT